MQYAVCDLCSSASMLAECSVLGPLLCHGWGTMHRQAPRSPAHPSLSPSRAPLPQVLAVLRLLGSFRRVLYVDVDVHHCDAVQVSVGLSGSQIPGVSCTGGRRGGLP